MTRYRAISTELHIMRRWIPDWLAGAAGFKSLHLEIGSAEVHPASTGKTRHQKRPAETGGRNGASIAKLAHGDQLISAKPRGAARFLSDCYI